MSVNAHVVEEWLTVVVSYEIQFGTMMEANVKPVAGRGQWRTSCEQSHAYKPGI